MSSTNKTANYKLSQYIGTDKPTYLGDYNADMSKIDAQMKANAEAASNAVSEAGTALSKAEDVESQYETLNDSVSANSQDISLIKTKNTQQDAMIGEVKVTAERADNASKQNTQNISTINSNNQWIQGTGIHNKSLPNFAAGSWDCAFNNFSKLLSISGQVALSTGTTISANTTIATIPANILALLNLTKARDLWSVMYLTLGDNSLSIQNLHIDSQGRIYSGLNLNNVLYLNIQVMLNTSAWD